MFSPTAKILVDLAAQSRIDFFLGLPCQSFTFARQPALRDEEHPLGKPGLSSRQQGLVDLGNKLAAWALSYIQAIHEAGGYLTVQNPYLSWSWWLPDWVQCHLRIVAAKSLRLDLKKRHPLLAQQPNSTFDRHLRRTMSRFQHRSPWQMLARRQTSMAHEVITELPPATSQKLTVF